MNKFISGYVGTFWVVLVCFVASCGENNPTVIKHVDFVPDLSQDTVLNDAGTYSETESVDDMLTTGDNGQNTSSDLLVTPDVPCEPICVFGSCGAPDGCGKKCGCPTGSFCIEGQCTNSCPVGKSCKPDLKSCYTLGSYAKLGTDCGCLGDPEKKAPDGAFCDPENKGTSMCTNGVCATCIPSTEMADTYSYQGTVLKSLSLGKGIDTAGNNIRETCVQLPNAEDLCKGAQGADSNYYINVANSWSELSTELNIDAAAHYGGGVYDAGGSVAFSKAESIRNDSAFLILNLEVKWKTTDLQNASLLPQKMLLLKTDPVAFVMGCGDQYVSQVTTGGFFRIVYHFKGVSTSAKKELSTKFNVESVNWGVEASFKNSVKQFAAQYETEVWVVKSGAAPAKLSLTLDELIAQAKCFVDKDAPNCKSGELLTCANATAFQMKSSPYQGIADWPAGVGIPSTKKQRDELEKLSKQAQAVQVAYNDVTFRLTNQVVALKGNEKCAGELKKLQDHQAKLKQWLDQAEEKADACRKIHVCGPSLACTNPLPLTEPLELPLMAKELMMECGPKCSILPGATYEIDAFGYCTKCTFTPANPPYGSGTGPFQNWDNPGKTLSVLSCRYMRPGAQVHAAACGTLVNYHFVYPLSSGVNLVLRSGPAETDVGHCNAGSPYSGKSEPYCYTNNKYPNKFNYSLSDDAKALPGDDNRLAVNMVVKGCDTTSDSVKGSAENFNCGLVDQNVVVCDADAVSVCEPCQ